MAAPEELAERIAAFAAECVGAPVRVENLRRMAGGASRELWSLDATWVGQRRELVLRRDPPGRVGDSSDRGLEAALLRAAGEAGVPVPHVHWSCDDPAVLDSAFFIMDRIEGETIPRRLLRDDAYADARGVMTGQLGSILAQIHSLDPERPDLAGVVVTHGTDSLEETAFFLDLIVGAERPGEVAECSGHPGDLGGSSGQRLLRPAGAKRRSWRLPCGHAWRAVPRRRDRIPGQDPID